MDIDKQIKSIVASELRAGDGDELQDLQIARTPIRGGLESSAVERVVARYRDRRGRPCMLRLVAKQLEGHAKREAGVYRGIVSQMDIPVGPRVLGIEEHDGGRIVLFLEDVRAISNWPWRDMPASRSVLQRLAHLHRPSSDAARGLPQWDYESELGDSAVSTLEQLDAMHAYPEFSSFVRRGSRAVERLVSSLPARRAELLHFRPFGLSSIHGDVHPGNALVRRRNRRDEPVLIDWGRARIGSALEDVSSWLQSLGYWEPEARRRHDTLLKHYLDASEHDQPLSSDLRAAYWMAAASNALAGALRYYCWKATMAATIRERSRAAHTARDWLRVIVRADAVSR